MYKKNTHFHLLKLTRNTCTSGKCNWSPLGKFYARVDTLHAPLFFFDMEPLGGPSYGYDQQENHLPNRNWGSLGSILNSGFEPMDIPRMLTDNPEPSFTLW